MSSWGMDPDAHSSILNFWWVPILVILGMDLLPYWFLISHGPSWILWAPWALLVGAQIAFTAWMWPRLSRATAFRMLLVADLGLEALRVGFWHVVSKRALQFGYGPISGLEWIQLLLGPGIELVLMSLAFGLARRKAETAAEGVAAVTGVALVRGGWVVVGLGPLLAWLWRDPLPFELCGGGKDQARAAWKASLTGLLYLIAAFLLPLLIWAGSRLELGRGLLSIASMLVGALAWAWMGGRWGRPGFCIRVFIGVGLVFAALITGLFIWFALSFHL